MQSFMALFADLYRFFSGHRRLLFLASLLIIAVSAILAMRVELTENIDSMLPDDRSVTAANLKLLEKLPFARKVLINLSKDTDISRGQLIEATSQLAKALRPPYFNRVVYGPEVSLNQTPHSWILRNLPNLVTVHDLSDISMLLTPATIQNRITDIYRKLMTPEGLIFKNQFQSDPMALYKIGFEKLMQLKLIPNVRVSGNHFISTDDNNTLILADTEVETTDFRSGKALVDHLHQIINGSVPKGIRVSFISGHRYTVANAETMKHDVWIVLGCSSVFILILYVAFFRTWQALFVFLTPFSVLCIAAAGISIIFTAVSAVTIGFGAVLLGISIDFAFHVYFAMRHSNTEPHHVTGEVARPVLLSGMTTLAAFSVLLFSSLPGQRQLAAFTLIGIICALVISIIVLPHLIKPVPSGRIRLSWFNLPDYSGKSRQLIIAAWLTVLMICAVNIRSLRFEGDLSRLFMTSGELRAVENHLKTVWGDFRHTAMIFTDGPDLEKALEANDRLYSALLRKIPSNRMISLSPVLPSESTQHVNRNRWAAFWSGAGGEAILGIIKQKAREAGFAPGAFEPFFLSVHKTVLPVGAADLKQNGWAPLVETMILESEGRFQIMTLVPDTIETATTVDRIKETMPSIRLVSQNRIKTRMGHAISHDFFGFLIRASLVVMLLVAIFFRNFKQVLLSLLPALTGAVVMTGTMGWLGIDFNLFNIIATLLVIGLSVDYGIFMVCRLSGNVKHPTQMAVFVSGLTTLAGFGALALARHPALNSIGVTVLLGIGAAIPAALWVIPAFLNRSR